MFSPTVDHCSTIEHNLCYLKGTLGCDILYGNHEHNRIECFTNADKAGFKEDKRSTSGFVSLLEGI